MGLPLYNPVNSLYLSDLEPSPEPDGHDHHGFPTRDLLGGPTTHNRLRHKRLRRGVAPLVGRGVGDCCHPAVMKPVPGRRSRGCWPGCDMGDMARGRYRSAVLEKEDRDVARSEGRWALPRRPSLEREEAFCGERMGKKGRRCRIGEGMGGDEDERGERGGKERGGDETVRRLYYFGVLYDHQHERGDFGEGFGFQALVHHEPMPVGGTSATKRKRGKGYICER